MTAEFWKTWEKGNEIERLKLIRTLTPFSRGGATHYMTATMMNSYLVDLHNYMKGQVKKEVRKASDGLIDPASGKMMQDGELVP